MGEAHSNRDIVASLFAVGAGLIVISALAFATDSVLQAAGVLPLVGEKRFQTTHALLALTYHASFVVLGCYLAARLAPNRPMAHALVLGAVGFVMSILGLLAIIAGNLAPAWYGWTLIVLSFPLAWVGGRLFVWRRERSSE